MRGLVLSLTLLALIVPSRAAAVDPARITWLGSLPGSDGFAAPHGIAGDGSSVVGLAHVPGADESGQHGQAFRWTRDNGMVGIGALPGAGESSWAGDASYDGSVIVGGSPALGFETPFSGEREAFRWTVTGGMSGLGDLPGGAMRSEANAVSDDGSVIVGTANGGTEQAFRWSDATGMTGLGFLPGGTSSRAIDVSADGSVVAGVAATGASSAQAFRWTAATGMVALGDFGGGFEQSRATALSADGRFVVGVGYGFDAPDLETRYRSFRWTPWTGFRSLGALPEGTFDAQAADVSADGHEVVGTLGSYAMIWDAVRGYRRLDHVLTTDYGLDLSAWFALYAATAVSDDGRTIVGTGTLRGGASGSGAWLLELPAACDDGLDGDADGRVDLADPDCEDTEDNVEAPDTDGDWWLDAEDDCPTVANPDQADADGDGFGDVCEHLAPVRHVPADHATIQAAIDAATDGTTIWVAPGVHVGNLDFRGKRVAVRSEAGPAVTEIEGTGGDVVVWFGSGETRAATLEGFTIRSQAGSYDYEDGVRIEEGSATLLGNVITGNFASGIYVRLGGARIERNVIEANGGLFLGGGIRVASYYGGVEIVANEIRRNRGPSGAGIYVSGAGPVRIEGNRIEDNEATQSGGALYVSSHGSVELVGNLIANNRAPTAAGVSWARSAAVSGAGEILHNTIAGHTGADGSGLFLFEQTFPLRVVGNVVTGEGYMVRCESASGGVAPVFSANDVFGTWASGYAECADPTGTDGNVVVDPRYLAPGGDYRLRADSPLVDRSAADAASLPERDALGAPRIADGDGDGRPRADLGALELAPTCANGLDDDGDGGLDFPADTGCAGPAGYEDPPCDDGEDDDGDGAVDFPADPGCRDAGWIEAPACDDGIDNDGDWYVDGGAPWGDPGCRGTRWRNNEVAIACGLGAELVIVLALLSARRAGKLRTR